MRRRIPPDGAAARGDPRAPGGVRPVHLIVTSPQTGLPVAIVSALDVARVAVGEVVF